MNSGTHNKVIAKRCPYGRNSSVIMTIMSGWITINKISLKSLPAIVFLLIVVPMCMRWVLFPSLTSSSAHLIIHYQLNKYNFYKFKYSWTWYKYTLKKQIWLGFLNSIDTNINGLLKHCQRQNRPEGPVLEISFRPPTVESKILFKFHLQNLDQASTSESQPHPASESRPRLNFITSIKPQ